MRSITRIFEFDAAHRVLGHEGKCQFLHGHRYQAEVTVSCDNLDKLGRVIDFSIVKNVVGDWIDHNWDHRAILNGQDPHYMYLREQDESPYMMVGNPTAEHLARELYFKARHLLVEKDVTVTSVKIWETAKCNAVYP